MISCHKHKSCHMISAISAMCVILQIYCVFPKIFSYNNYSSSLLEMLAIDNQY